MSTSPSQVLSCPFLPDHAPCLCSSQTVWGTRIERLMVKMETKTLEMEEQRLELAHQLKLVATGEELRTQVKSCLSLPDRGPYPCPSL